jgi:CubicO group peptidase (beta-lactamase class C family)
MMTKDKFTGKRVQNTLLLLTCVILLLAMLVGCSSSSSFETGAPAEELAAVDYTPLPSDNWDLSTPQEQGLDPLLVAELYHNAVELETLYSLLVVKNGHLIAEDYFNGGSVGQKTLVQSASKSYISALVGIALEEGCLSSVDQKMVDFFPEYADQIIDLRKKEITIQDMLQMRTGYPDEETDPAYLDALYWGEYPELIVEFPLVSDPGTRFYYSNLTYSWLAIMLHRVCGTDLKTYAQEHLFQPMDTEVGDWLQDRDGHYIGSGGIHVTARDAAQFGLLYLNDGEYDEDQIIPADWVRDSLKTYSEKARSYGNSLAFRNLGYGYGWWSAEAGDHQFSFAWGHGGQLIVLLDELDMVVVTTADPFFGQHNGNSWKHEKATFNLVGDFIDSLPGE